MITQAMVDAAGYLIFSLNQQFENAMYGMRVDTEPVAQGVDEHGDHFSVVRPVVTIMVHEEFEQTARMFEAACEIVHFIYRQHGVMIQFRIQKEDSYDEREPTQAGEDEQDIIPS